MKCLSNFGHCFRCSATSPSLEAMDALPPPHLIGGAVGSQRAGPMSCGRSGPGAGAHWRPKLATISEDFVDTVEEKKTNRKKSAMKKRSVDRSKSFILTNDNYRRASLMSMPMPMFAISSFMF
ncbi:hypothetical protein SAY87_030131 [Trapa incisa]|uniref:Uncharacterized protein n=1 Tax=Trapa incisa TaxID=236973 RepID=A0AAN7KED0_9MYRT|nr:hypothetical protein SAY87_030131 [Trapa incisa]